MGLEKRVEKLENRLKPGQVFRVWVENDWRQDRPAKQVKDGRKLIYGPTDEELAGRGSLDIIVVYVDDWREDKNGSEVVY